MSDENPKLYTQEEIEGAGFVVPFDQECVITIQSGGEARRFVGVKEAVFAITMDDGQSAGTYTAQVGSELHEEKMWCGLFLLALQRGHLGNAINFLLQVKPGRTNAELSMAAFRYLERRMSAQSSPTPEGEHGQAPGSDRADAEGEGEPRPRGEGEAHDADQAPQEGDGGGDGSSSD